MILLFKLACRFRCTILEKSLNNDLCSVAARVVEKVTACGCGCSNQIRTLSCSTYDCCTAAQLVLRLDKIYQLALFCIVLFAGLHDLDTQLYEQGVTLQEWSNSINERGFEKIYDYYKKFRAFHFDRSKLPRDTEARAVLVDKVIFKHLNRHKL